MIERLFNGYGRLTYLNHKDRLLLVVGLVGPFVLFGGLVFAAAFWRAADSEDLKNLGYHRAEVLYATILEREYSRPLFLRLETVAGQVFSLVSTQTSLFALTGQDVCIEIFENKHDQSQRASLVANAKCVSTP